MLTGAEVTALSASLVVGVRAPIQCWPIAVDRVRYVGEPVAVVVAADRYLAEDALDLIEVDYEPLPAVVDPKAALGPDAPVLHEGLKSNVASDRSFRYGDPERAFAEAAHKISVSIHYPRNSCTPIETYGVVADYDPGEDAYDVLANFMGPVHHASGDGAGAEGAGQPASPAHAAGFRRQLRRQAGRVSLHRADGARRARRRQAGEMDRGPAGASRGLGLRHQPRDDACRPRSPPTAA